MLFRRNKSVFEVKISNKSSLARSYSIIQFKVLDGQLLFNYTYIGVPVVYATPSLHNAPQEYISANRKTPVYIIELMNRKISIEQVII